MTEFKGEKSVNIRELRKNLSGYLRRTRQGAAFTVTSRGQAVARIVPPGTAAGPRAELIGLLKGELWMAPDFDETPDELIAAMEK